MNISVPQQRYLIINGDDFGLSPQVNAGVLHAHQQGVLTNSSLMIAGLAWQDAVARAKDTPSLSVGLHLTLVQGKATLPPHCTSAITDFGGNFPDNPTYAGLRYFFSWRARDQVRDGGRGEIRRHCSVFQLLQTKSRAAAPRPGRRCPAQPALAQFVQPHDRSPFVSRSAIEWKRHRSGRADQASGRCRAGAGFAWRLSRTGRSSCWLPSGRC